MEPRNISEVLLKTHAITRDALDEALEYQKKFGFGLLPYLVAYDYIKEEDVARSIASLFRLPYLVLAAYEVANEIIKLVPAEIAKKYLLLPIDKMENILTVVMVNPLDVNAIEEVEKATKCGVQPFVGVFSDVLVAIEKYYKVTVRIPRLQKRKALPIPATPQSQKDFENRKSIRLPSKLDIHFPVQKSYQKGKTKDLSADGLLFESDNMLPIGSFLTLQVNLPEEFTPYPVAAVVQVARVKPLENGKFDIGVKIVKLSEEGSKAIMAYSRTSKI